MLQNSQSAKVVNFPKTAGCTAPLLNICVRKCSVKLHTVAESP